MFALSRHLGGRSSVPAVNRAGRFRNQGLFSGPFYYKAAVLCWGPKQGSYFREQKHSEYSTAPLSFMARESGSY